MMNLEDRVREYAAQLEADAPQMGELLPEGEVLASVAEHLRELLGESR